MNNPTTSMSRVTRERLTEVLSRCDILQACAPDTILVITRSARIEHHASGKPVHRLGEPMTDLSVILVGVMEASQASACGKRHINAYLPAGSVFGLVPLLDDKGCTHDTWARGSLTMMRVPRHVVLQCMDTDPAFLRSVLLDLCERSRMMFTQLGKRALLPLRARTAWTLNDLAEKHGFRGAESRTLNLKLPQDGLADLLGVTRQSTNRELKQLERDGMIKVGVSEIDLVDIEGLRSVAQSGQ